MSPTQALSAAAADYVLTLADDEHMIGARHTGWIGLGPFLEEDLAFCSIAQDELGHAIALYRLVAGPDGNVDALAFRRDHDDYRSSWACEWPADEWGEALVRHWLYDRADELRLQNVAASSVAELAELVPGIQREEHLHLHHAQSLLSRVTAGGLVPEIEAAIGAHLPLAASVWLAPELEADALAEGVATRSFAELAVDWNARIDADLASWGLDPAAVRAGLPQGGETQPTRRVRSAGFAAFHADLNAVIDEDPLAVW